MIGAGFLQLLTLASLLATSAIQTSTEALASGPLGEIASPARVPATLADEADLELVSIGARERLNPGEPLKYSIGVANRSGAPAQNVVLRVELPAAATFQNVESPSESVPWSCGANRGSVTCSTPTLPGGFGSDYFQIHVLAPSSRRGAVLTVRASVSSDTPDLVDNNAREWTSRVNRILHVSSEADSGPGSLRAVLEEANRDCDRDGVPCRVLFRISPPVPAAGWFTISLASPLPPITVTNITLEGGAQTEFTGDTNPSGPEVYLNGHSLDEGHGLDVRSSGDFEAASLVVSGFPGNGILFSAEERSSRSRASYLVRDCYIGTDPTGTIAVPNRERGIAVFVGGGTSHREAADLTVESSVISGNARSGILVHSGYYVTIRGNRIGVSASSDEPLPNGASGIYFGMFAGWGCVYDNVIAHNAHFGVSLERQVPDVWILQNSIKGNALFGIDIGLDLATPGGTDDITARPVLTSARYDPSNGRTTISGFLTVSAGNSISFVTVDLYGNSALHPKGEGETWLGSVDLWGRDDFTFVFDGSLLGGSVTATATLRNYVGLLTAETESAASRRERTPPEPCQEQGFFQRTSEFSEPVVVTP